MRNPIFPQLLVLIFQQLKNTILVEVLEAIAGRVLGKYMGFQLDQLHWLFFLGEPRSLCSCPP